MALVPYLRILDRALNEPVDLRFYLVFAFAALVGLKSYPKLTVCTSACEEHLVDLVRQIGSGTSCWASTWSPPATGS